MHLPQSLCTFHFLCLDCSFARYSHGLLPHFPPVFFLKYRYLSDAFPDHLHKILPTLIFNPPSLSHLSCVVDFYSNESCLPVSTLLCRGKFFLFSSKDKVHFSILLNLFWLHDMLQTIECDTVMCKL